ncbi:MAG: glycosyltransferase [Methanobrevibacter wolinii]|nr:glycosyltransferase [Methanobrevibacter wolinii]
MVKVSVIVPIYNTEIYLKECLNSVINQTLKDIEIICINDGSTDNSLKILEYFAKIDKRVTIFSQKNKGQGSARNLGLKHAKGEYICFVDSDDVLKPNELEDTYNISSKKSLDFLIFKLFTYNEETGEEYSEKGYEMQDIKSFKNKVFNYNDLGSLIFRIPVSPVNKLYNGDFLRNLDIKFPENLIFEDNVFFWDVIFNAKRISLYDEYLYIRRRHSNSSTGNVSNKHLIDTIKINNLVIQKFIDYNHFEEYKNILFNRKINSIYFRFSLIVKKYKSLFFNEMKKDFTSMLDNNIYDSFLNDLNYKNKNIFINVIKSSNCEEFMLNMKIFELNQLKNENKKLIKDKNNLEKSYNELLNSSSWRITKPLRSFKRFLKNLIHNL